MEIEIDSEEIENYAVRVTKQMLRKQIKDLMAGELEALKNFSQQNQKIWDLSRQVSLLEKRIERIENKKWWKKNER